MRKIFTALIALAFILANISAASAAGQPSLSPEQKQEVKSIVRDYLLEHPEILKQMAQKLRKQEEKAEKAQADKAIAKYSDELFHAKGDPVMGNPKGKITLVEFMDYQCPHCKHMVPVVSKLIENNSELRVVVKELPIYSQTSYYAAMAAFAAYDQNKFKAFHHALFNASDSLSKEKIIQLAKQNGLDVQKLKKQIKQGAYEDKIKANYRLAQKLGLRGTPALVIGVNGKHAEFINQGASYERLQSIINKLKKQS